MSKTGKVYELFRVKRGNGKVTTVSVDPILVIKASQLMRDPKAVGQLVREAARSYEKTEENRSCSGFVTRQLRDAIAHMQKNNVSTYTMQSAAQ